MRAFPKWRKKKSAQKKSSFKRAFLRGVSLDFTDRNGRSPAHVAAAEGQAECLAFLVGAAGLSADAPDRFGHSPLEAGRGHPGVRRVLEERLRKKAPDGGDGKKVKNGEAGGCEGKICGMLGKWAQAV